MGQIATQWPCGDGKIAGRISAHDCTATLLGSIQAWPQSLRTTVDLLLPNGFERVVLLLALGLRCTPRQR